MLFIWLLQFINPCFALQSNPPLARHFTVSSATQVDREHGSGARFGSVPEHLACCFAGIRVGEASHPGPATDQDMLLNVGLSNPGGLRAKEDIVLQMGPGIWTMAETQLSTVTTRNSARSFKSGGRKLQRVLRPHYSHPAPLRQGSNWAGKWTGVCTISDWPSTRLLLPWPHEQWITGRVLLTRHWVLGTPITVGGFYGYAQGPTWPKAKQLSDQLLETFTREVVIGMSGIRLLVGDYNQDPGALVQQQVWERYGWCNAQTLGIDTLQHEWMPTCKHATERDQIWLSPEAAQLMRGISIQEHFADHATIAVQLAIPTRPTTIRRWPRPAEIPWDQVTTMDWTPPCEVPLDTTMDPTKFLQQWAKSYEDAISEQLTRHQQPRLHARCRGRAQRLTPETMAVEPTVSKPSRQGEVCLQSSMVGVAVRRWFNQLRRLQSLCHAIKANKQTPAAVCYRASLWTAIVKADGFHPDFRTWWMKRESPLEGAPTMLPEAPPGDHMTAFAIYQDFHQHFRAFETWHLAQRNQSLKIKYEGTLSSVYMDLRDEPRANIDHVWKEQKYQVLAVDADTNQIMLDRDIEVQFDSIWFHDQEQFCVSNVEGAVCTVGSPTFFEVADEVVQRIFVSDVNDVLTAFEQHWTPRWNMLSQIPAADWTRIVQFTQAYMPRLQFHLPQIDVEMWYKAVTRFKPKAARGPDGFSKSDLQHMPRHHVAKLIHLFHLIETTDLAWPMQLLFGTVIGLAKRRDAHEEGHFRPITLFSMIFRCWSKLRTQHMIRQIAQYMPAEALGFLPHRETTELWLLLQGQIELMLSLDAPLGGLSSDVKRAFNHIGRKQVFHMGNHLGYPVELLTAWQKFLDNFVRRFDIRGCLGHKIMSDSGFPEGDPLSIVAMLTVNWGYHVYMRIFMPKIQAYSFVDNLTLAAREAITVIQGHFAMLTYSGLFGLTMDEEKTFVWGLSTEMRKALQQLGFPCQYDASELGASMSYGFKIRNRHLKMRGTGMEDKWKRLRASLAPFPQKLVMLHRVFWPKALHGSPSCVFAEHYLTALRRAATKSLKINGAGSNPMLRLSLSDNMQNDPGFYQLNHCLQTMRRLLRKTTDLLPMWKAWQRQFSGKLYPGPFTKLNLCLHQIGWSVEEPPWLRDHDQHQWNLVTVDDKTLQTLLHDAWCQFIASKVNHKTMQDLVGMDHTTTTLDYGKTLPMHRALLSALQSGAFISADEHARYDQEKSPMCTQCSCEDDRAHWLNCPRYQHLRMDIAGWHPDNVQLPACTVYHLLIPRLAAMVAWKEALLQIQDRTNSFLFYPPKKELQHVFIDGSCTAPQHTVLRLAAWGVLSATSCEIVAMGHLNGLTQTIDRAELTALVVATRWSQDTDVCIWSDSLSNVQTAEQIQHTGQIPSHVENYDLWLEFHEALQARPALRTDFRWVPSHVHESAAEDAFESWAFRWNNLVDSFVTSWNLDRPENFMRKHKDVLRTLTWWSERVRQLRAFYFSVAEHKATVPTADTGNDLFEAVEVLSSGDEGDEVQLVSDQLPVNWQVQCRQTTGSLPGQFLTSILQWLCAAEQFENPPVTISDLEFVFILLDSGDFAFPFQLDGSTNWQMKHLEDLFQKPTMAMLLRPLQQALQQINFLFPDVTLRTPSRPAKELGVYISLKGLRAYLPRPIVQQARERLISFTCHRPVRRAGDLARPVT